MNDISVFLEHIYEDSEQRGITLEESLRYAKSSGIDHLECDHWRLADRSMKVLFDSCGVGVSCIYEHFSFLTDSAERSEQKYRSLFETAVFYGCTKVLCIPGFSDDPETDLPRFAEGISGMCEVAKEYGITVTVENFDDMKSPCCRMKWLEYLLDNVSGLCYTFDTGNFRYCLEEADEAYDLLKRHISHVHCKDRSYNVANSSDDGSNGKADLSGAVMYPSVVGDGVIGMEKLVKQLVADGYTGTFAIEHFGANDQAEYMKKSAHNLRGYLEA